MRVLNRREWNSGEFHPNVVLAEGGAWHEPELLKKGWSAERLVRARRNFLILGWHDRFGGWHYPKWQFDAALQVLPHVVKILRLLRSRDALHVMSHFLVLTHRGQRSCLGLIQTGRGDRAVARVADWVERERNEPEVTVRRVRGLQRALRNIDDPTRYVVASSLLPKASLVYDLQRDSYAFNHVSDGAIIRDKKLAECIAEHLAKGKRRRDYGMSVLPVRKTKRGHVALKSIPGSKGEKPWRPTFPAHDDTPVFVPITTPDTRAGFVDAMLFASENREHILRLVAECADRVEARERLTAKCGLTPRQADAILDMPLAAYSRAAVRLLKREFSPQRRAQ